MNLLATYIKIALQRKDKFYEERVEEQGQTTIFEVPSIIYYGGPLVMCNKSITIRMLIHDEIAQVETFIEDYVSYNWYNDDFDASMVLEKINHVNINSSLAAYYLNANCEVKMRFCFDVVETDNLLQTADAIVSFVMNDMLSQAEKQIIYFEELF